MIFLRNLLRAKVRNALTLFGIATGTAIFVAIASLTFDMNSQIDHIISAYNTEVMIKSQGALTPNGSKISRARWQEVQAEIDYEVMPMIMGVRRHNDRTKMLVIGVQSRTATMLPLVSGNHFQTGKQTITAGVLGATLLGLKVGESARIAGRDYAVAGLYRTGSKYVDSGIVTDLDAARHILGHGPKRDDFNLLMVQTGSTEATARVIEIVRQRFPRLRAQGTLEFSGTLQILRTMEITSWSVALISLLGAAIVIANTFVMTVAERTRELGILMSIGWSPWLVLRMLFAESLMLSMIGTALGNLMAYLMVLALAGIQSQGPGWSLPDHLSAVAMAISFAVALALAVVALLWPAAVVFRLQPARAVRHE